MPYWLAQMFETQHTRSLTGLVDSQRKEYREWVATVQLDSLDSTPGGYCGTGSTISVLVCAYQVKVLMEVTDIDRLGKTLALVGSMLCG